MSKNVPRDDQETAISWNRGEDTCQVRTTDPTEITKLKRAGYMPVDDPSAEPYQVFVVPREAISYRSEETIRSLKERGRALARRVQNRTMMGGFGTRESTISVPSDLWVSGIMISS